MLYICVVFGGVLAGSLTRISKDHVPVLEVSWRGRVSWAAVQLCTPGLAAGIQRGCWGGRAASSSSDWLLAFPAGAHELHAASFPGHGFLKK